MIVLRYMVVALIIDARRTAFTKSSVALVFNVKTAGYLAIYTKTVLRYVAVAFNRRIKNGLYKE